MPPLVSVIIPTCNRSRLLQRALRSAAEQSVNDLEIIVVDDQSDDDTGAVAGRFPDGRVRYVLRERRGGGAAARNAGLRLARGEYVAFLDDDDEWLPDKLARQLEAFERAPDAALVYTGALHIRQRDGRVVQVVKPDREGWVFRELLQQNFIRTTSSIMVRRQVLEKVGFFDERLPACQDWDLCLRIAREYPVACVSEPLLRFYIHPIRITHDLSARIRGKEHILGKYLEEICRDAKILSKHYLVLGRLHCHNGEFRQGRRYLLKGLRQTPWEPAIWKFLLLSMCGGLFYGGLLRIKRNLGDTTRVRPFMKDREDHGSDSE